MKGFFIIDPSLHSGVADILILHQKNQYMRVKNDTGVCVCQKCAA